MGRQRRRGRKLAPEVTPQEQERSIQVRLMVTEQAWRDFRAIAAKEGVSAGRLLGRIVYSVIDGEAHFDTPKMKRNPR